jgi:hypothetical protein
LDPQQVASRATGHFQPCFPASRPVSRPVFALKVVVRDGNGDERLLTNLHDGALIGVPMSVTEPNLVTWKLLGLDANPVNRATGHLSPVPC